MVQRQNIKFYILVLSIFCVSYIEIFYVKTGMTEP